MQDQADIAESGRRSANAGDRAGGGYRLITTMLVLLIAACLIGGYFFLNQMPEKTRMKIAAGPYRSDSFELMREVADVVSRHSDWLTVEPIATRDSSQNTTLLNDRTVDAATIRSDTPVGSNVRLIANLFPDYFLILTRRDKPVFQIKDLLGKKVAIPRFGSDEFRSFWIIGDHYDLPINQVKWRAMEFETATSALLNGEVDAIFTVRSLRDRRLLNLFEDAELKDLPLRFIPVDQAESISLKRPFLDAGVVPKGAFVGREATPKTDAVTATVDRLLVTRTQIDPEIVREITRVLFEHRFDLTIRFSLASAIKQPDFAEGSAIALHEGAEQYYRRDEPSFIQENAEPLALMVTVMAMMVSSLIALRSRWVATQKNKMDSFNYVLLDIAEKARASSDITELKELRDELFRNLETVVIALDTDAITDEGFQSFSLLWESVKDVVNDRLREVDTSQPGK